jgi:23S rRNA pseudouridine1911/1915/1917 synthase
LNPRTLTLTVTAEQAGRRVRSLLQRELGLSGGRVAGLKRREGTIRLNGKSVRTIDPVRAGDVLTVEVGDVRAGGKFAPLPGALDIRYEDDDLLILNKPGDMAAYGRAQRGERTAANALAAYLGTEAPFHPVNRLDRGTTGLMCVAKTGYIHDRLRRALHGENFCREYLAVAVGTVMPPTGVIDLPITRVGDKKFGVRPDGAPARTRYETLGTGGGLTLLCVRPETGRTHQIRVHFAAAGYPLFGDWLYGRAETEISRPALHSYSLRFLHPVTGEEIRVSAPLPADMKEVLQRHAIETDIL